MSLVLVEKRSVRRTSHGSYIFVLPKVWVRSNYPSLPPTLKVLVVTGKYVVIAPDSIGADEIGRIKRVLAGGQ